MIVVRSLGVLCYDIRHVCNVSFASCFRRIISLKLIWNRTLSPLFTLKKAVGHYHHFFFTKLVFSQMWHLNWLGHASMLFLLSLVVCQHINYLFCLEIFCYVLRHWNNHYTCLFMRILNICFSVAHSWQQPITCSTASITLNFVLSKFTCASFV